MDPNTKVLPTFLLIINAEKQLLHIFGVDSYIHTDPKLFNHIVVWVKSPTPFVATLNISFNQQYFLSTLLLFFMILLQINHISHFHRQFPKSHM